MMIHEKQANKLKENLIKWISELKCKKLVINRHEYGYTEDS